MKNQRHKGVREMQRSATPIAGGERAEIDLRCMDTGLWTVNGDPCSDDLTAARLVLECLESLADARVRRVRSSADGMKLEFKRPCNDCPFRRASAPGWLGDDSAENFVSNALADYSDVPLPCHQAIDYEDPDWMETQYEEAPLCVGAVIFAKNYMKRPRDPVRAAWQDQVKTSDDVFRYPYEFLEHHGAPLDEDMKRQRAIVGRRRRGIW